MSASLTWTDALGAGVLGNIIQIPTNRFDGWTPDVDMIGEREHALGTGIPYAFEFRSDDLVSLRIDNLKGSDLAMARRLKIHLLRGGEVGLNATNELADLFASATIAPDTKPTISEPTRENREYSMSMTLRSGTGSFVPTETGRRGGIDYGLFGLQHDWDADALIGIVLDGSTPSAFIDVVAGANAVQSDALRRPTFYEDSGPNGHAMLEFSRGSGAAGDVMKAPVIGNPGLGSTIFLFARTLGVTGGSGKHVLVNFYSAGFDQSLYRDGFVSETKLLTNSGSGDLVGDGVTDWFVAALVIDAVQNHVTPFFNGEPGPPFPIYAGWNALKELWFGYGPTVGGTGTANMQVARTLYFDSAFTPELVRATTDLLVSEYGPTAPDAEVPVLNAVASTATGGAQASSIVQNVPAGVVDGQMLLWAVHIGSNLGSVPWPAGWTEVSRPADSLHPDQPTDTGFLVSGGSGATLAVAYKLAASEPASYTMTLAGPEWFVSTMVAVRSGLKGYHPTFGVRDVALDTSDKTSSYLVGLDPVASPWDLHADFIYIAHEHDLVVLFGAVDNTTAQTGIIYKADIQTELPFGDVHSFVENANYCSLAVLVYTAGEKHWQANYPFMTATGTGVAGRMLIAVVLTVP